MPTNNPVPSTDPTDLLFNAQKLDQVVNGSAQYYTDRLGVNRRTMEGINAAADVVLGGLGYAPPVTYASGISLTLTTQTIEYAGEIYAPKVASLPFTTSTWATDSAKFRLIQGVAATDLAASGGAAMVGYIPAGTGAVATNVQEKLREFVSAKDFGAENDSATDNSIALQQALASGKKYIRFPNNGGSYKFSSVSVITLQNDVVLDFEDAECDFTGSIQLIAPAVTTAGTLAVNVSRYATSLILSASYPAEIGDVLVINTTIPVESSWGYTKKDCVRIKSISGASVELEEPLNFAYTTADAGLNVSIYKKRKVTLLNTNFKLSAVSGQAMVDCMYLSDVVVSNHKAVGSSVFDPSTDVTRRSIRFLSCFNVKTQFLHFENLSYPMLAIGGSRNITADVITLIKCRHAFEPADWAKTVNLSNITGSGCFSAISAHPAFDVWYENVNVSNEIGLSNLRSVGGGIVNATVHTIANDSAYGPYFHTVALNAGYTSLYDDADLTFDGFEIKSPNRTKPTIGASFGRQVTVNRTKGIGFATGGLNAIGRIVLGYGNRFSNSGDVMLPPKYRAGVDAVSGIRAPLSIATNPLLRVYESGGRYHIDPSLYMVDQSSKYLRCYGQVVSGISGEPANIPLRIHTNAFSEYDSPGTIFGVLKLKAKVRHSNSGGFATQEKWFNFCHKTSATSSVEFPTAAVFTSGLSGQANESLALTISSISQAGFTEAGAGGDFYVDLQASLASGRTSPVYSLEYELELSIL